MASCLAMSFFADEVIFFSCTLQSAHSWSFAGTSLSSDRPDGVPLAADHPHSSATVRTPNGTCERRHSLAPSC